MQACVRTAATLAGACLALTMSVDTAQAHTATAWQPPISAVRLRTAPPAAPAPTAPTLGSPLTGTFRIHPDIDALP